MAQAGVETEQEKLQPSSRTHLPRACGARPRVLSPMGLARTYVSSSDVRRAQASVQRPRAIYAHLIDRPSYRASSLIRKHRIKFNRNTRQCCPSHIRAWPKHDSICREKPAQPTVGRRRSSDALVSGRPGLRDPRPGK